MARVWEMMMEWLNPMGWLDLLANGWLQASVWQVVGITLAMTHLTIASVTIYLHRHQAHRALDLHPAVAHVFRFWLWLTTGMVTREWAAIHRKHHARCEREGDPHSPRVFGIRTVFWQGAELYRAEAGNTDTLKRFGHGTPDDAIERHLYSAHPQWGVALMLLIDLALFGVLGLTVWAVQMLWIPVTAAGIINGLGHYWGYRNFESQDASTNLIPWGIVIGGEELHNNHHTYPTSARLSVKPYEFDIGWFYIRVLQGLGLARVKKTPPRLAYGAVPAVPDEGTLEALIAHRYEMMAGFARGMQLTLRAEWSALQQQHGGNERLLRLARRWLHRDDEQVPVDVRSALDDLRAGNRALQQMHAMREELRQLWSATHASREQLAADLRAWCQRAEDSGIAALREFSLRLRSLTTAA